MAYTALEKMRLDNMTRFGVDAGPFQPALHAGAGEANDLKSAALRFIHEECEGLRFKPDLEERERGTGTSLCPGQIPYNMQMDIDRLCLERALERFIDSGVAEDAYDVYYCYMEMFFGHYGKSKRMVELLSEFEANGSALLMKHRDHYSHSVYVFALGLAIYETNEAFRRTFGAFYGFSDDGTDPDGRTAANMFLEYWGMTALFHDIGYPFELPFEQILSYFEVDGQRRGNGSVYMAYHDVSALTALDEAAAEHFRQLYGRSFASTNDLFAHDIAAKLGNIYGIGEEELDDILCEKPLRPDQFDYYMDHAWFSALRLYHELVRSLGPEALGRAHVDALTAILLHNSLYKFKIAHYKDKNPAGPPLRMELHPLAWLLMLCDELQCWDRTAYGRNSRTELHPMKAEFDFSGGAINAVYYFDTEEQDKIDAFHRAYAAWEEAGGTGEPPRLKAYSDMAGRPQRFTADIRLIVDLKDAPLTVTPASCAADRRSKHTYLSGSSFLHLYDFAVALNGRYAHQGHEDEIPAAQLEAEFEELSLEYQLSNINQAKSFSRYLNAIGCFYTDRPVAFPIVTDFTPEQTATFAPMEHERWVRERITMGWSAGNLADTLPLPADSPDSARRDLREQLRMHRLAMDGDPSSEEIYAHYLELPEAEQDKDWKPFNSMLRLIKKFDGLRIYRLEQDF